MPEIREVGVRGGRIELEVHGDGPPLILLHGWAMDRRVWQPQIEPLARHFQLVVPDRRGFGRSSAPPDLALEADDLTVIRRALGLERTAIVAMSQAGRVALQFTLAHPEAVRGLVLQGVPLDGFHPQERAPDAVPLDSYRALARSGKIEQVRALWRTHPLMRLPAAAASEIDPLIEGYEGRDLNAEPSAPLASIAEHLGDIWAPAMVITGENDTRWRQLVGDALACGLADGVRAVIPGAFHLCNLSHAEEFNALVTQFLLRIEERSGSAALGSVS